MSTAIKTNKLIAKINRDEYEQRYDIFLISTSEKYIRRGAFIIDAPFLCNNVIAIYFESGQKFYVMMNKDDTNKKLLKKVMEESDGGDVFTVTVVSPHDVDDNILVQLLLNSLATYELDFMKFNNLTGHLYCFHPKWVKKSRNGNQYTIMKVPCLEFKVSDDMILMMQVHTFTSELLRNHISFKKKKFEEYPKYVFSANNTLRRKLKGDTGNSFIMRQTDGAKTEIPFMNIQDNESFDTCKMGILANIIEEFDCKFGEFCNVEFASIDNYTSLEMNRVIARENEYNIKRVLESSLIRIVDGIGDEYSEVFCKELQRRLKEKYSITASIGRRYAKNALNVCVIHNAIYYDGMEDPHKVKHDECAVQHITLEDFMGSVEFALSTVIHELLIKNDICQGSISLFDWAKLGIEENIAFGIREEDEEGSRYFFMEVKPDGSFSFNEQTLNLFELNQYSECVEIFEDNPAVCGIIKGASGDINVISDTNLITIPEIKEIKNELIVGNTQLRGKIKRAELLSSVLDIKLFNYDGDQYYFVGTIGEGMRTKVVTAANIRKIETYKCVNLMFEDLLPLMNVTFVRNGQLTIVPFPFKYLREYIKTIVN